MLTGARAVTHIVLLLLLSFNINALGINCRGSGLCPLAAFNRDSTSDIIQFLRDILYISKARNSTTYSSGEHIICIGSSTTTSFGESAVLGHKAVWSSTSLGLSGRIGHGGICLFPQSSVKGFNISIAKIKPLVDALIEHTCTTCGSVPVDFIDRKSNDPRPGILTFNYVEHPICTGKCISNLGTTGVRVENGEGLTAYSPTTPDPAAGNASAPAAASGIQVCSESAASTCTSIIYSTQTSTATLLPSSSSSTLREISSIQVLAAMVISPSTSLQLASSAATSIESKSTASTFLTSYTRAASTTLASPTSTGRVMLDTGNGTSIDLVEAVQAINAIHPSANPSGNTFNIMSCPGCVINQRTAAVARRMLRYFKRTSA